MNNKTKATIFFAFSVIAFVGIGIMQTTQAQIAAATICIIEFQTANEIARGIK